MKKSTKISIFSLLTFTYFLVELSVGYLIQSLALQTDAYHMLSDVASSLILLVSQRYMMRKPDNEYTYGWKRAEIMGSLWNSLFLVSMCFFMILESIQRFIHIEEIKEPKILVIVASIGFLFNLFGLWLFGHHHHHSTEESQGLCNHLHDHSHHKNCHHEHHHSLAMSSMFLHVLGDALGSLVVIASGFVIWLTDWNYKYYLDPILSVIISLIILKSSVHLVKQSSRILMQSTNLNLEKICQEILDLSNVSIKGFHVWSLDEQETVATIHLITERDFVIQNVKDIFSKYGISNTTIQIETK